MSFWSAFPFVRILLFFIGGILWAYYMDVAAVWLLVGLAILMCGYVGLMIILPSTKFYYWNPYIGIIGLSSVTLAGALCLVQYKEKDISSAFAACLSDIQAYTGVALEDASKKEDRLVVTLSIQEALVQGHWKKLKARVRLYIREPAINDIHYGDIFLVLGAPKSIPPPLNPHVFNLQAFLSHQHVYYQHHIYSTAFQQIGHHPPSQLKSWIFQLRHLCKEALGKHIHSISERGIILALVLGIKDELDTLLQAAYASAGTMHVLAVSGLHVGLLYVLLSCIVCRRKKTSSSIWIRSLGVLIGLWTYAGITGFVPSVLRATLMLSLVELAKLLRKTTHIYNILSASAFLLLLINPLCLFSVSFQLSYLAVVGIVYLQPKIYRWVVCNNWILRQLWLWTSVSLAAQLATTPIGIYYFHQFPLYFIVANWVVVPAAFLIFIGGVGVLLTSFWPILSTLLAWVLVSFTRWINRFVVGISQLPHSSVTDVYLTTYQVFLWYGLLICILLFLHKKKFFLLILPSVFALLLCINHIQHLLKHQFQQGVIFYSIYPHQILSLFKGRESVILVDGKHKDYHTKVKYQVMPSQLAMGMHTYDIYTLSEAVYLPHIPLQELDGVKIGVWGNKKLVFIDQPNISWPVWSKKVYTDFLIIENNSISTLVPLCEQFVWETLIIGTSNTKALIAQLQQEAQQRNITVHSLLEEGAFTAYW